MYLCITAGVVTDSITEGFLPAADHLDLPVVILTNHPEQHRAAYANMRRQPTVIECAVHDPRAVLDAVCRTGRPAGLLSNSDHLQFETAVAADFLGLPAKDWRAALCTKDKHLMRHTLNQLGLDGTISTPLQPREPIPESTRYPAVVKPRHGVASEDVYLIANHNEAAARTAEIWQRRPNTKLVIEEYLPGTLYTYETLGDNEHLATLGSWHVTLQSPPTFNEASLEWDPDLPSHVTENLRRQLRALGIGLGACHTEFVLDAGQPRLIEVNYRLIGERMDLTLAELLRIPLFEYVIRLHMGESLGSFHLPDPTSIERYARAEWISAWCAGTLVKAPGQVDQVTSDVHLTCRPLSTIGTTIAVQGNSRDNLAMICAVGVGRAKVTTALNTLRNTLHWTIK